MQQNFTLAKKGDLAAKMIWWAWRRWPSWVTMETSLRNGLLTSDAKSDRSWRSAEDTTVSWWERNGWMTTGNEFEKTHREFPIMAIINLKSTTPWPHTTIAICLSLSPIQTHSTQSVPLSYTKVHGRCLAILPCKKSRGKTRNEEK